MLSSASFLHSFWFRVFLFWLREFFFSPFTNMYTRNWARSQGVFLSLFFSVGYYYTKKLWQEISIWSDICVLHWVPDKMNQVHHRKMDVLWIRLNPPTMNFTAHLQASCGLVYIAENVMSWRNPWISAKPRLHAHNK